MKILYISKSVVPSRLADSINIMKMANGLMANAHAVKVVVPDYHGHKEEETTCVNTFYCVSPNLKVKKISVFPKFLDKFLNSLLKSPLVAMGFRFYTKTLFSFALVRIILLENPDLVYCRFLPGAIIANCLGKKVILESHAPFEHFGFISRIILKLLFSSKYFLGSVVITKPLKESWLKGFGEIKDKILVASDASDIPEKNSFKIKLELQGNYSFNLGYAGHLYPGRGVELIFELAKRQREFGFHIWGGNPNDVKYWIEKSCDIENFIVYGFVQPAQISQYHALVDVLLAPYQNEISVEGGGQTNTYQYMSPMKVFEYMAAEKAIICSDIPVLREVLNDRENCFLCPTNNVDIWEKTVVKLLDDKNLRLSIAKKAFQDLSLKYTWKSRAEKVLEKFLGHES
ncbi:MAG: glycosyltransferase [Halobacteriovoraceae bacterium]|nr:glycosyltransferase [Halobacteriovoraceae bacterium]